MSTFRITTNKNELDVPLVHRFLSEESAWAKNIPLVTVQRAIENSLCFGGFIGNSQIAFARVISDHATFANLVDVFVLPDYRGNGYGKLILNEVLSHPQLQNLRRFTLATADAHSLYSQFGFKPPLRPQLLMERYFPNIYDVQIDVTRSG